MSAVDGKASRQAAMVSVAVGLVVFGLKMLAWRMTDSSAIMSDALESTVNVGAAALALFAIRVASMPADSSHPYGHGKAELFSAGFEGALIMIAGVMIIVVAVPRLFDPQPVAELNVGLILLVGASLINGATGYWLVRRGRALKSLALEADGKHVLSDVWTSVGVIGGLILVKLTDFLVFDAVTAIVMAGVILVSGLQIVRRSIAGLMDEADESLLAQVAEGLNDARESGLLEPHDVRAVDYGEVLHVDLHLYMPRFWDLVTTHATSDRIEASLAKSLGRKVDATPHIDPCENRHCVHCDLTDCPVRSAEFVALMDWTADSMKSDGRPS